MAQVLDPSSIRCALRGAKDELGIRRRRLSVFEHDVLSGAGVSGPLAGKRGSPEAKTAEKKRKQKSIVSRPWCVVALQGCIGQFM